MSGGVFNQTLVDLPGDSVIQKDTVDLISFWLAKARLT